MKNLSPPSRVAGGQILSNFIGNSSGIIPQYSKTSTIATADTLQMHEMNDGFYPSNQILLVLYSLQDGTHEETFFWEVYLCPVSFCCCYFGRLCTI